MMIKQNTEKHMRNLLSTNMANSNSKSLIPRQWIYIDLW